MASWQYVFLFPSASQQLQPGDAVEVLSRLDLKIDSAARRCVPIDSKGHLLDTGDQISLAEPVLTNIAKMLNVGEQFSVHARDHDFILTALFAHRSSNPHVFFGWPRKLLNNVSEERRSRFWEVIGDFAKRANAAYVIVVDDAPDDFEDQFLQIDGLPYLDLGINSKYGHGVLAVWVHGKLPLPQGASFGTPVDLGNGFTRFCVIT